MTTSCLDDYQRRLELPHVDAGLPDSISQVGWHALVQNVCSNKFC